MINIPLSNVLYCMIDDLLAPALKVVFCGTALSKTSFQQQAYYAHPGNKFYSILYSAGFTDKQLNPHEYKTLLNYGIGLTDINKTEYGQDKDLSRDGFDASALRKKILHYQPKFLAFTSKRAAQAFFNTSHLNYGETTMTLGKTRLYVLPSTSGRASGYWDSQYWEQLAQVL